MGRNLDLDYVYQETVTITPRRYPLRFRQMGTLDRHYAMIGMAYVLGDYPLYYDATNEAGLSMAGLNFPGNAVYRPEEPGRDNVTPFEFIPWVLGRCATVAEARVLLDRLNLWGVPFRPELPLAPLHWMISDRSGSITVESVKEGLQVYDNPAEVLTNNPPFDYQMTNLSNYLNLTPWEPENHFSSQLDLTTYVRAGGCWACRGPVLRVPVRAGGLHPAQRRLRTFRGRKRQPVFPHSWLRGPVPGLRASGRRPVRNHRLLLLLQHGSWHLLLTPPTATIRLPAVDLHGESLEGTRLVSYPLVTGQQIRVQNGSKTWKSL